MGDVNRWRVNITCPRCGHRGDVEEDFPCGHGEKVSALVAALESTTCIGCETRVGAPPTPIAGLAECPVCKPQREALRLAGRAGHG